MILTTTASVDGRITLSAGERLLEPDVGARWGAAWPADVQDLVDQRRTWIEDRHAPTVVLEGSGTFVATEAESPWSLDDSAHGGSLHHDHLPRRAPRWFVVVDGRGRVDWTYTGDDETALLVLVCEATPAGYLRRLRDLGVGHLVAGVERVDLRLALERLYAVLGVRAVVADGVGGVNGALIGDGLVDEVHVITFPVLIGGLTTPTSNERAGLDPGGSPVRLLPRGVVLGDHGSTWARYDVAQG